MSWKREVLLQIDARLDLPQPARSRVILEIAADLEDTSRMLMERGHSPEEAREQAIRRFEPRGDALREITTVHAAGLQRFLGRFSGAGRRRWERALLVLLFLFLLLGTRVLLPPRTCSRTRAPGCWRWSRSPSGPCYCPRSSFTTPTSGPARIHAA